MAARKKAKSTTATASRARRKIAKAIPTPTSRRQWSRVTPDALDLRDRPYQPTISRCPRTDLFPPRLLDVKSQGETNACTGFALATVVEHLVAASGAHLIPISGFMLYSMARRYDEFPGAAREDTGSSLRGALKGWHHHGASAERLWRAYDMPPPANEVGEDWWLDAARRPLGAYYRVDTRSITDMHVALNEVGILYASAVAHAGWDKGVDAIKDKDLPIAQIGDVWTIPFQKCAAEDCGHAFAIVGYNSRGFLIQNSWGTDWGSHGFAILTYRDWLEHAMDCWVTQIGVVTEEHREVSNATTLRTQGAAGPVRLASDEVLRARELSPFIVNMENNGRLSRSGTFRTMPGDIDALASFHLVEARKRWGLTASQPIDVAIYAHGGLTDEEVAAETAAAWIPALYNAHVFPIFLMWETGFWKTLCNLISDVARDVPRVTGGPFEKLRDDLVRWWNARLEGVLACPGTAIWGEMKQNANALSDDAQSGVMLLYEAFKKTRQLGNLRLHVIGHSAGAIVHSHLVDRLVAAGQRFENMVLLAPAVRVDSFRKHVEPHLESGKVSRLTQFHLTDAAEQADPSCGPYRRSLLYLVSRSFEGGELTPILGMEKSFDGWRAAASANVQRRTSSVQGPTAQCGASTHGGFDNDERTRKRVVELCSGGR